MFARALFVLLLVLNVGVAAWWATRAPPSPPLPVELPHGIARLQLVGEAPDGTTAIAAASTPAASPTATSASTSVVATKAAQCVSFGPYPDEQAADLAQSRLQALAQRVVARAQPRGSARGWRVMLPALPDTAQAEATAARIAAAGFTDYFVVREGSEANSIALGRYGNESAARRRAEALVAAGFAARAEAIGGTVTWLDVLATADLDVPLAQQLAVAPERRPLDCATLR